MRFDVNEWRNKTREDRERAWHEGPRVITPPSVEMTYPRYHYRRAKEHPVFSTIGRLRELYLSIGFEECCNPLIVEEREVYRQFGPEAMAVLDRVFYLGGLPRPNIGISREKMKQIEGILGRALADDAEEGLREKLHAYKKAEIDGDDLVHEISFVLKADDAAVVRILEEVFHEFRNIAPESSRMTLRSHMTSGWFITLGAMWDRSPHPIRLFSIDRCFRREQAEGPTRLMSYHSASCVVAGEDVTNEEGKAVSEVLLSSFGFSDFRFQPDEKRSKYYIPETQTEVYARHPKHGWVEVATFGLYSPSALAEYGIGVPVMNLGLGVERLAMIIHEGEDVRVLTYPQLYPFILSDREIARAVTLKEEPATAEGRSLARSISGTAKAHATAPGPCSFAAWRGEIHGREVEVYVEEKEEGAKLCGPACFNEVCVHQGSVLGIPPTEKWARMREEAVSTGILFLDAVSALASARIEVAARCGEGTVVQVKMARSPADINLHVAEHAMRFITDNKKKVDVRGPVFLTVRSVVL
ncbi:MAG: O-phosphoserine--tRNA ligase [Methanomicrobiales archaeon]|nr:O-phosphoserine--tRNA ligase [Methanomicrobiales archaeon]